MVKTKLRTERVQEILARRGISQNNLAQRLKITSGYCSQLLRGTRRPSPGLRNQLMAELDEEFDSLFVIQHEEITAQEQR